MNAAKREALKQAGFQVGTIQEFLGLDDWENQLIELKYQLSKQVKERREVLGLTQKNIAEKIQSSQSRVAKIEAGSEDVSLDLLIRYLYAVGGQLGVSNPGVATTPQQPVKPVVAKPASTNSRRKTRAATVKPVVVKPASTKPRRAKQLPTS